MFLPLTAVLGDSIYYSLKSQKFFDYSESQPVPPNPSKDQG